MLCVLQDLTVNRCICNFHRHAAVVVSTIREDVWDPYNVSIR